MDKNLKIFGSYKLLYLDFVKELENNLYSPYGPYLGIWS